MKNSVKKALNVICMIFFMWFVCSLLFGCSNSTDNEITFNNKAEEQLEVMLDNLRSTGEYKINYFLQAEDRMITINIDAVDKIVTFNNMKADYNSIEIQPKIDELENVLNNSIILTLRENDYEGTILINFNDCNGKTMFNFTSSAGSSVINSIENKLEETIKEEKEQAEKAERERQEQIKRQQEEEQRRQEEIRKQQENILPQAAINYLDNYLIESEGAFNYEMENGKLVISTQWVSKEVALIGIFNGNEQYMNSFISSIPESFSIDVYNLRTLGVNNEIVFEIITMGNISYKIVSPENSYEVNVIINKF